MPKRPKSHVLGDIAVDKLCEILSSQGWLYEIVQRDYGEDILVRTGNGLTPNYFFIQSKATSNISRYRITEFPESGYYFYPVSAKIVSQWLHFKVPVVVTLYDANADIFLWQEIQTQFTESALSGRKAEKIVFSRDRFVDDSFFEILEYLCRARSSAENSHSASVNFLLDQMRQQYGIQIMYDPMGLVRLPLGKIIREEDGNISCFLFGSLADEIEPIAAAMHQNAVGAYMAVVQMYAAILELGENGMYQETKDGPWKPLGMLRPNALLDKEALRFRNWEAEALSRLHRNGEIIKVKTGR